MTKHKMKPLSKKITKEDLEDLAHDPTNHFGSNPDFKGVFHFLTQMGVIGGPGQVAFDIYGDGPLNEETEAMKRAGKSPQTAGQRRLEGLRYGRRSFTHQEALYFHDAFRIVCGDEWADAITAKQFVTQPIDATMSQLVVSSLPAPWETLNPAHVLRMLSLASTGDNSPSIRVQRYADDRLSRQKSGTPVKLDMADDLEQLNIGEEFRVCIENLPESSDTLVIEYLHEPMAGKEFNFEVQGQVMRHMRRNGTNAYVTAADNKPLEIEPTVGRFGFCLIVAKIPGSLKTVLPDGGSDYLSVNEMRGLVKVLRQKLATREASIATTNYEVRK